MSKEQLLDLIKDKERELYSDYIYSREHYGHEDKATIRCGAEWSAVSSLLDNILDLEEDENN
jgi:hypothetical protein